MPDNFRLDFEDSKGLKEFEELNEEIDQFASSPADQNGTWLISYADLMTLVACFFIMLVALAKFDDISFQEKAKNFAYYFRGNKEETKGNKQVKPITGPTKSVENEEIKNRKITPESSKDLYSAVHKKVKSASISEIDLPKSIKIIFSGSAMFEPGKVELSAEVSNSIEVMIDLIMSRGQDFLIIFEGHTDDTDISNKIYPSNWELSAARAGKVLKKFQLAGVPKENLVAVGYGDSRPLYQNRDKAGKAIPGSQRLNRRVVIKVISKKSLSKEDAGLGIFFRDE